MKRTEKHFLKKTIIYIIPKIMGNYDKFKIQLVNLIHDGDEWKIKNRKYINEKTYYKYYNMVENRPEFYIY